MSALAGCNVRKHVSIVILLGVALLLVLVAQSRAATPTVQGAAYKHLKTFMSQYDKAGFSKVVKIGNAATYRTTLSALTVKVDKNLGPIAVYDPRTKTITFSRDPRTVPSAEALTFGQTVWHELTHAIEDAHGDIGVFDNAAYAERNIDYMTDIVDRALPALKIMESKANSGQKAAALERQWRLFVRRVGEAATLDSTKQYPPNMEIMHDWFGFDVNPDHIKNYYLGTTTKKWKQLRKALAGEPHSWAGKWDTDWGLMTLSQSGSTVSGAYTHDTGIIHATASGKTLTGRWGEAPTYKGPTDAGSISFTMSDDGRSFTGTWTYDGGGGGGWVGTRVE